MKQLVRNVKIIGTGSCVPDKVLTNEELEKIVPTNSQWIFKKLGIKERRIASDKEATSDLAAKAAIRAIENSGLTKDDIDLIIVATATPDRLTPSTGAIVQDKIQAYNSVAFDISAVCSGFLYGMSVATQFIAAGVYDNVLVIGADTFSKIIDWTRRDAVFFGDGDGSAVFTDNNEWADVINSLKVHGKGSFKYDNVRIGMNSRLDTLQAAILKVKFDAFKNYEVDKINKAASLYSKNLVSKDTSRSRRVLFELGTIHNHFREPGAKRWFAIIP